MAGVWATGSLWLKVPESVLLTLDGVLRTGVFAKDVALHLAKTLGPSGAEYKCMEFTGSFFHDLTISSRMVLCNMSMEMGAKAALSPVDAVTRMWFEGAELGDVGSFSSDADARFCDRIRTEVSGLTPLVSGPHKVEEVGPVEEAEGIAVDQAFIGTCTNGRLEDLAAAAMILKGRKVASRCRLIVAPASRQVLEDAIDGGIAQIILSAGGAILPPGCGPCLGAHEGVIGPGEVCISSSNRNFPGRMGSDQAEIYLASPATVAASAVEGRITDPRRFLG
jgi:homoaconitase/3-isopropylmalate dehydratase large subunit